MALHFTVRHPVGGSRSHAPRLVFVHGFTQTGRSWEPTIDALPEYESVLLDAPGHGGSSAVETDLVDGASLMADAGGRGVYVGYSMGGRFALHVALTRPELVSALVLVSATGGIDSADQRAARRESDNRLAAELEHDGLDIFLERWLSSPLFAHLGPEAAGLDQRRANTVSGLASSLRLAGTGTQEPLWDRLSVIEVPVLVIAGEYDEKFTTAGARLTRSIGGNAKFVVVPGAGHTVHLEQPGVFVRVLREWLSTLA
ncbi:MAG: alpha/beta fold hydrolase [Acidimicrobiia bacterium]